MILALLFILVIGLALYETGYGVNNTFLKSLQKQTVIQVSAALAFMAAYAITHLHGGSMAAPTPVDFGFLGMLAYISTTTIKHCHLTAIAAALIGGILFPVVLSSTGSLGYLDRVGYMDYAGSGVVHWMGGIIALFMSLYSTKVLRRQPSIVIRPYSATAGFLVLWAGWIAYVGVLSAPVMTEDVSMWVRGLVNMSTSTAWGAVGAVAYMWLVAGKAKMRTCTVGGLAGMVAMSADPFSAPFWAPAIIGVVGGVSATLAYGILRRFNLSDPSNAISIHLFPGLFGTLIVPLFNNSVTLESQVAGVIMLLALASSAGVALCELQSMSHEAVPSTS